MLFKGQRRKELTRWGFHGGGRLTFPVLCVERHAACVSRDIGAPHSHPYARLRQRPINKKERGKCDGSEKDVSGSEELQAAVDHPGGAHGGGGSRSRRRIRRQRPDLRG